MAPVEHLMKQLATALKELQFIVRVQGKHRRVCKITFTNKDASLYLLPYAAGGQYFFGRHDFPEEQVSTTFSFAEQLSSQRPPKISIHESGQVHIRFQDAKVAPVCIPEFATWRGEHLATVVVDRFDELLVYEEPLKDSDLVFAADDVTSGRFAIYANGAEPRFKSSRITHRLCVPLSTLTVPLHIGIAPLGQEPVALPEGKQGVTVVCGWNPSSPSTFLFVRGQ
jgi:hypothetical protein